ncbi:cytochrome B562 [Salmonella enterica]|nr:cytochrome B562 [Salmonella enterica subsp. enterica serovar Kentucky]
MDSVHHIWCPLFSQEFQDLPDGAETTLTDGLPAGQVSECDAQNARRWLAVREKQKLKMKTMQEQTASTEKIER